MSSQKTINRPVNVNAWYFKKLGSGFRSFPKRMEFDGHEYTFLESGLQMLVQKGQDVIKLFEMTDGEQGYKLRFDQAEHNWTLVTITPDTRALS